MLVEGNNRVTTEPSRVNPGADQSTTDDAKDQQPGAPLQGEPRCNSDEAFITGSLEPLTPVANRASSSSDAPQVAVITDAQRASISDNRTAALSKKASRPTAEQRIKIASNKATALRKRADSAAPTPLSYQLQARILSNKTRALRKKSGVNNDGHSSSDEERYILAEIAARGRAKEAENCDVQVPVISATTASPAVTSAEVDGDSSEYSDCDPTDENPEVVEEQVLHPADDPSQTSGRLQEVVEEVCSCVTCPLERELRELNGLGNAPCLVCQRATLINSNSINSSFSRIR
jgi:hypothetical protein